MSKSYNFPKQSEFGKTIAKSKIYEKATVSSKLKDAFVNQVEKIIWSYKLSPKTINIKLGEKVEEIQVFTLRLKTEDINLTILEAIDKAIPSPIIFRLIYADKIKLIACYKRKHLQDKRKCLLSDYFSSAWCNLKDSIDQAINIPTVLNLDILYHTLLESIISEANNVKRKDKESFADFIDRLSQIDAKEKELAKIQSRLKKEKQFNRKFEINKSLNLLKKEIGELSTT